MSVHSNTANAFTQPAGGWQEDGWKTASTGDEFWRNENINMPPGRRIHTIPTPSLAIATEPKSEPVESKLPSVAGQQSRWQGRGGRSGQRESTRPEPIEPQLVMEALPHVPYQIGRQSASAPTCQCAYFRVEGATDDGFPLQMALENKLETLFGGNARSPFEQASAKVSIRIQFNGCVPYTRQIMARRSTAQAEPISMKDLAHKIAQEVDTYLKKSRNAGKPPMHRGRVVQLEDLYLWRLVQVSPGSWTPEFKVMRWILH